ncbi:MAG: hypothetical protein MPW15_15685 [Candidatus Manganitrophus sp.]|nr:hypothetical protein [Candidatus Manganitrophus sp.]
MRFEERNPEGLQLILSKIVVGLHSPERDSEIDQVGKDEFPEVERINFVENAEPQKLLPHDDLFSDAKIKIRKGEIEVKLSKLRKIAVIFAVPLGEEWKRQIRIIGGVDRIIIGIEISSVIPSPERSIKVEVGSRVGGGF